MKAYQFPLFFLQDSENIPKFAAEKENLSDSGALNASKQNNILKFNFQYLIFNIKMAELLDETDLQILKTLQKNAKLTTKELADAVHLTPTPVFERQKRLEKQGYIKKYVAVLDPEKLNQGLLVFCKVKLQQINHEMADAFTRRIMRIPEVTECYNTSGSYDYLLKVRARDMKQYQEFVLNKLGDIANIGAIESTFVMSEVKQDFGINI